MANTPILTFCELYIGKLPKTIIYDAISGLIGKMDDKIITRFDGNVIHGCGSYRALQMSTGIDTHFFEWEIATTEDPYAVTCYCCGFF